MKYVTIPYIRYFSKLNMDLLQYSQYVTNRDSWAADRKKQKQDWKSDFSGLIFSQFVKLVY